MSEDVVWIFFAFSVAMIGSEKCFQKLKMTWNVKNNWRHKHIHHHSNNVSFTIKGVHAKFLISSSLVIVRLSDNNVCFDGDASRLLLYNYWCYIFVIWIGAAACSDNLLYITKYFIKSINSVYNVFLIDETCKIEILSFMQLAHSKQYIQSKKYSNKHFQTYQRFR